MYHVDLVVRCFLVGGEIVKQNFRYFVPSFFKVTFARFSLKKYFIMPWQPPVDHIRYPSVGFKKSSYEDVTTLLTRSLWDFSSDGSRWFHSGGIKTVTTLSSSSLSILGHFSTTLQTTNGYIPIILPLFDNSIILLVGIYNICLTSIFPTRSTTPVWMRYTYRMLFRQRRRSYDWRRIRLLCRQLFRLISSKLH